MITTVRGLGLPEILTPMFYVNCRITELTDEEQSLVEKYKDYVNGYPILGLEDTLRALINGITFEYDDVDQALACEAHIQAAWERFINRLRKMNSFSKKVD
jgi:hypothetical protein